MTTLELINPKNLATEKTCYTETYREAEEKVKALNEQLNKKGNISQKYWTITRIER